MIFGIFFFSVTSFVVSFALLHCMEPANRDRLPTKTAFVCTKGWSLWTGFTVFLNKQLSNRDLGLRLQTFGGKCKCVANRKKVPVELKAGQKTQVILVTRCKKKKKTRQQEASFISRLPSFQKKSMCVHACECMRACFACMCASKIKRTLVGTTSAGTVRVYVCSSFCHSLTLSLSLSLSLSPSGKLCREHRKEPRHHS